MRYHVKFLPRAERDFFALPEAIQDEILEKAELLSQFPRMGVPLERAYGGYRSVMAGRNWYRIVYLVKPPRTVEIAYIRHCRRQFGLRPI